MRTVSSAQVMVREKVLTTISWCRNAARASWTQRVRAAPDEPRRRGGVMEALLLTAVAAVIVSSLAAGFRTRVRLAAGLYGAAYPSPVSSFSIGPAGRGQAGASWRCLARVLLRPSSGVIMLAAWLMVAETALTLAAPC